MNDIVSAEIRSFFDCRYAIPVGSGTSGLFLAFKALRLNNRKVIIPILTCPNVAVATLAAGAIPLGVPVSSDDYCLSVDAVGKVIDSSVGAIVAVDAFGYPANVQRLKELAAPYECKVLEDACQAYGGKSENQMLGIRGDIGVVSFGYSKSVALGGGGFLLTDSTEIFESIEHSKKHMRFQQIGKAKNQATIKLMRNDSYRTYCFLSKYFGLLNYDFPYQARIGFPEQWARFNRELEEIKTNLLIVQELVASYPMTEEFNYLHSSWLPWRYSFRVRDIERKSSLVRLMHSYGIRTSQLYRPIREYLDILSPSTCRNRDLVEKTINLHYKNNAAGTRELVSKLKSIPKSLLLAI